VVDYQESEPHEEEPHEEDPYYYVPRRRRKKGPPWAAIAIISFVGLLAFGAVVATIVKAKNAREAARAMKKVDRAEPVRGEPVRAEPARWDRGDAARERQSEREREERGSDFMGIVLLFFAIPIYFLPTIVALLRKHNNLGPIVVVNFRLGCVFVGWVVALAWALTDQAPSRRAGPI
jgi:hypothetical protein